MLRMLYSSYYFVHAIICYQVHKKKHLQQSNLKSFRYGQGNFIILGKTTGHTHDTSSTTALTRKSVGATCHIN